jgi:hypothetical protein
LLKNYPAFDIAAKSLFWLYNFITEILKYKKGDGKDWAIFTSDKIERRIAKEIAPLIEKLR